MADRPGGEPTEEPTAKRLREARQRGEIARSADFTSGAAFMAGVGALLAFGPSLIVRLTGFVREGLERAVAQGVEPAGALGDAMWEMAHLSLPVVAASVLVAAVVGGLQAQGLFTLKPVLPQGARIDPAAGLKRIFSSASVAELVKSLAKIAVVAVVAYATLWPALPDLVRSTGRGPATLLALTSALAGQLLWRIGLAYLVIGGADYLWQRRRYRRSLRMTRDEVKREHRESEGDPHHKAERQRLHRELSRHAMVEAVRTADCVIVNPEHIAIALRFDEENMGAPQVVAKGERLVAAQIREVARQHGVPIYRDVNLARTLNELDLGVEIPAELYDAVAEVLRWAHGERSG